MKIYPFVRGPGIDLFAGPVTPTHLTRTDTQVVGSGGTVVATYTRV
ncbi:hypothetical protein [Streptomyces triticagri]|nr:hypothetical protein [Streptomyces triticagri]